MPRQIRGVTSNMYQISADDIGTEVLVEAQPADFEDGLFGVALGELSRVGRARIVGVRLFVGS